MQHAAHKKTKKHTMKMPKGMMSDAAPKKGKKKGKKKMY